MRSWGPHPPTGWVLLDAGGRLLASVLAGAFLLRLLRGLVPSLLIDGPRRELGALGSGQVGAGREERDTEHRKQTGEQSAGHCYLQKAGRFGFVVDRGPKVVLVPQALDKCRGPAVNSLCCKEI